MSGFLPYTQHVNSMATLTRQAVGQSTYLLVGDVRRASSPPSARRLPPNIWIRQGWSIAFRSE